MVTTTVGSSAKSHELLVIHEYNEIRVL